MISLETSYMGLSLKNPIIVGSCPLTSNIDSLKKCEDAGAGAVVIKSIFEEQIDADASAEVNSASQYMTHADAYGFLEGSSKEHHVDAYLNLVQQAKQSLQIPVIASINCKDAGTWLDYGKRFADCGADALELNYYIVAANAKVDGEKIEKEYLKLVKMARKQFKLPLSLKLGSKFSSLSNMIRQFDSQGINGLVLFNRFFTPDIDIQNLTFKSPELLSDANDFHESLRWTALMSDEIACDICASTGIHSGETIVKQLLAGASSVQVCSAVIKNGFKKINQMLGEVETWMESKQYTCIPAFQGKLAQERMEDPGAWERTQYMSLLSGKR